jgi:hypothetical protein
MLKIDILATITPLLALLSLEISSGKVEASSLNNGRILRVNKSGNVEVLLSNNNNLSAFAIDGSDLIFSDVIAGKISRFSNVINQSVLEPRGPDYIIMFGLFLLLFLRQKTPIT